MDAGRIEARIEELFGIARDPGGGATTVLDERVVELAEDVARRVGVPAARCVSWAGHDAQHVAARKSAALLFAASANGVSHAPDEAIDGEDVERAMTMLAALLPELAKNREGGNPWQIGRPYGRHGERRSRAKAGPRRRPCGC